MSNIDFNDVLEWLNCSNRMKFETLKLAFDIFHDTGSKYFSNYLCLEAASRSTRHRSYFRPSLHVKSWWGEQSFKFTASRLWLQLPINISECTSFQRFKYAVFTHLLWRGLWHFRPFKYCSYTSYTFAKSRL
jgi:hypothetical protein